MHWGTIAFGRGAWRDRASSTVLASLALFALGTFAACVVEPVEPPAPDVRRTSSALTWMDAKDIVPPDTLVPRAFGYSVLATKERIFVGDVSARSVYLKTPSSGAQWVDEAKITRAGAPGTYFGIVVGASSDSVFVRDRRASGEDRTSVDVYRASTGWAVPQTLPNDTNNNQEFGRSVSIDGSSLAVGAPVVHYGAPGEVYTYTASAGGAWVPSTKIQVPPQAIGAVPLFGRSVALHNGVLAIGSAEEDGMTGAVYIYEQKPTGWTFAQRIAFPSPGYHGRNLCYAGDVLVVGRFDRSGPDTFAVSLFTKGPSGYVPSGTLDAYPRTPASLNVQTVLLCDAGRVAIVLPGVGVNLFSPSGAGWTLDALPLPADTVTGSETNFSLHGDALFAGTGNVVHVLRHATATGSSCNDAASCISGYCVDGICCNSACGDNNKDDCQACATTAGAKADGICGPIDGTHVCRAAASACDVADVCDGQNPVCPADTVAQNGLACPGGACASGACVSTSSGAAPASPESPGDPSSEDGCSTTSSRPAAGASAFALLALAVLARVRRVAGARFATRGQRASSARPSGEGPPQNPALPPLHG